MSAVRLHLGCGRRELPGWLHIDAQHFDHIDYQTTVDKLDMFADNSVDEIYACHVLEHIPRNQVLRTIKEWNRVLKVGAKLRVAVPDWDAIVDHCSGFPERLPEVMGLVTGGQRDVLDHHTFVFNFQLLSDILKWCGFEKMRRYPWKKFLPRGYDDYSRCYLPHMDQSGRLMSLNMAALKKTPPKSDGELPLSVAVATGQKKISSLREEKKKQMSAKTNEKVATHQQKMVAPLRSPGPKASRLMIGYANFYSNFENTSPIVKLIKTKLARFTGIPIENIALVQAKKHRHMTFDLVLGGVGSSSLNSLAEYHGRAKLLWAQEHVVRQSVNQKAINQIPDFAVGYIRGVKTTDKAMRVPNWMFYWDFLYKGSKDTDTILKQKHTLKGRKRRAAFVARLAHGQTRKRMVSSLTNVLPIDCPGRVANNTGGKTVEQITGIKDRRLSKLVYIRDYLFNLCPENDARHPGYVTEKLIQACVAGCIPIYWGHPRLEPGIINPDRIIWCSHQSSVGGKSLKRIRALLSDEAELAEFFHKPIFLPTARERILAIRKDFDSIMERLSKKIMTVRQSS